jgi:hypothetical protein
MRRHIILKLGYLSRSYVKLPHILGMTKNDVYVFSLLIVILFIPRYCVVPIEVFYDCTNYYYKMRHIFLETEHSTVQISLMYFFAQLINSTQFNGMKGIPSSNELFN